MVNDGVFRPIENVGPIWYVGGGSIKDATLYIVRSDEDETKSMFCYILYHADVNQNWWRTNFIFCTRNTVIKIKVIKARILPF